MELIDKETIRAEIERRRLHFNKEAEKYQALNNGYSQNCYGARDALRDLENFLDTLPEQPVTTITKSNALFDKCVENCDPAVMKEVSDNVDKMLGRQPAQGLYVTDFCKPVDPGIAKCVADHWWELLDDENAADKKAVKEIVKTVHKEVTRQVKEKVKEQPVEGLEEFRKEVIKFSQDHFDELHSDMDTIDIVHIIARHVYELGKNARKEDQ